MNRHSAQAIKVRQPQGIRPLMRDLRDEILKSVTGKKITASIIADDDGIVAETGAAAEEAKRLGLVLEKIIDKGSQVTRGDEIARFHGSPKQVVMAEDVLIGVLSKPSGIATAAAEFVKKAGQRPKIVCGAWKKMPGSLKDAIRRAVVTGGAHYRISRSPFVYLDKNYLNILGGIKEGLKAVKNLTDHVKVVQLKGRYDTIVKEACEAVKFGASILFIDTGQQRDVELLVKELHQLGLRSKVSIAFGGGIGLGNIDELKTLDIDILDIGRQIVDAPLLDMRLDVVDAEMV